MSVQKIHYECPLCRKTYSWFEADKLQRTAVRFFCTGCWQMIDVDDLIVYDENPEAAQTGCVGDVSSGTPLPPSHTPGGIGLMRP